jgi:hypothetical protein
MMGFRFATILCAWLTATSVGREIHVNNVTGDDRLDGARAIAIDDGGGPTRSIAKALRLAVGGDRIVIANTQVPYHESVSLVGSRHGGGPAGPLVIEGNGATLDGSGPIRDEAWTWHEGDVFWFLPARLGYQQLFFGVAGPPALRHPVATSSPRPAALEPLEWCLWDGKIFFRAEPGRLPRDYALACCGLPCGITLYRVDDVQIDNLVIQGFHVDGLNASDGVRFARLSRLLCRANGRSGISVGGSSRVEITGCTLVDNGAAQLRSEDYAHINLVDTQLIDSSAPAVMRQGGEITVGSPLTTPIGSR